MFECKRVPKHSLVPLAENLSHKMSKDFSASLIFSNIFYNLENVTYWQVCLTSFLFFLEQRKRSDHKQTTAMSSLKDIKLQPILFHCLRFFLKGQARTRQISSRE